MMFYSAQTRGFYDEALHGSLTIQRPDPEWVPGEGGQEDARPLISVPNPSCLIPGDAVVVTSEAHAALMLAQSAGKSIEADAQGVPIAIDPAALPLPVVQAALMIGVDDAISAIYSRFTRFETEYVQREAAARAFKAGGYQGDAGVWVMSFATNAAMTATAAANLIISQADGMRVTLQELGALRMGKYGIAAAASQAAAQAVRDNIIAQAKAIAASL